MVLVFFVGLKMRDILDFLEMRQCEMSGGMFGTKDRFVFFINKDLSAETMHQSITIVELRKNLLFKNIPIAPPFLGVCRIW